MTRSAVLLWLERTLLIIGVALGAWCLGVLAEARLTQSLSVRGKTAYSRELPGDGQTAIPHQTVIVDTAHRVPPSTGTVLGHLDAPSWRLSTIVLEGSDDRTLRRAAGHLEDTPLPGEKGNIGIAGHRDTVFRPLRRAKVGDPIDLTTADRVYHYRITKTLIVDPEDVYVLDPTSYPTLTLITCYPFEFIGHAPRRFVVQAELGETDASLESPTTGSSAPITASSRSR